jgi:hypothetical protein
MSISRPNIKKLDTLWSTVVKEKAKWKCEHCGKYDSRMEAAHVVGRRHRFTRWGFREKTGEYDLAGHCLCHTCHQEYDEHGPREEEIVSNTIGVERKEYLQACALFKVAKGQVFEEIEADLERERAANDDSPYSGETTEQTD